MGRTAWIVAVLAACGGGGGGGGGDDAGGGVRLPARTAFVGNEISIDITAFDIEGRTPRKFASVPGGGGVVQLAIDGAGRLIALTEHDVVAFDGAGTVLGRHNLDDSAPAMAVDGKTAYLALINTDEVGVLDLDSMTLAHKIPVGKRPIDLAIDAPGRRALVLDVTDDAATVIDLDSGTAIDKKPVASGPSHISIDPVRHKAYVSRINQAGEPIGPYLQVMDSTTGARTGQVGLIGSVAGGYASTVDPIRDRVYVAGHDRSDPNPNDSVVVIETVNFSVVTTARMVAGGAKRMTVDPRTGLVYVAAALDDMVTILDSSGTVVARVPVGSGPMDIVISGDGPPPATDAGPGTDAMADAGVDASCSTLQTVLPGATCVGELMCGTFKCRLECNGTTCTCSQNGATISTTPQGTTCDSQTAFNATKSSCTCFP